MKTIILSLIWPFLLKSKIVLPLQVETPTEIAERMKPKNSEIVHQVIRTDAWDIKNVIIAFYETRYIDSNKENRERQYVEGYLLIQGKDSSYKKVLIDKFEDDNVDSNIEAVFFANTDKDEPRELFIISTVTHRLQYLYEGTEYSINAYDNFDIKKIPSHMEILNTPVHGGFEGYMEKKKSVSKYKTAADVKKKLKQLGF